MLGPKTRVLLILSQNVLDRARTFAGTATASLKLPVSLQIVLRALIEEGLKRDGDTALLHNVERQAQAVRDIRAAARRRGRRGAASRSAGAERRARRERPGRGPSRIR